MMDIVGLQNESRVEKGRKLTSGIYMVGKLDSFSALLGVSDDLHLTIFVQYDFLDFHSFHEFVYGWKVGNFLCITLAESKYIFTVLYSAVFIVYSF